MPNMTDYAATYRTFRSRVPERFDFVTDVIERWAADRSKLAMLWVGRDWRGTPPDVRVVRGSRRPVRQRAEWRRSRAGRHGLRDAAARP